MHLTWGYDLVSQVQPGDRVLHWQTHAPRGLVGWSEVELISLIGELSARAGPVSSGSRVMRWPLTWMVAERAARRVWTSFFADAGLVVQVAADGEGGEHNGQVRLDRLPPVVEHRPGPQV